MRPHRGTMILVFGILGLICCPIFAILAWVMGNADLRAMREGQMNPEGMSLTNVGRILGIVGTVLLIIGIILQVLALLGVITLPYSPVVPQPVPR